MFLRFPELWWSTPASWLVSIPIQLGCTYLEHRHSNECQHTDLDLNYTASYIQEFHLTEFVYLEERQPDSSACHTKH